MQTHYERGPRIGRTARIRPGSSAIIFDPAGEKILLTRRSDNGRWCLPGGGMDPGESIAETCIREVREETSLEVRIVRLIGIYSTPDVILVYPDQSRHQILAASFQAEIVSGTPQLSDETTEIGFFSPAEIATMDLLEPHRLRIADALANQQAAFFR